MRTMGGHRRISILEIRRIRGEIVENPEENKTIRAVIYCRVSSHEQKSKGDLERQIESAHQYCKDNGYFVESVLKDVGSGLNAKCSGLKKLFKKVEQGTVDTLVVTYRDRPTRFGFDYFGSYFGSYGVNIIPMYQCKQGSVQEELGQDLIAIITSFSGKVHGLRSHSKKRGKKLHCGNEDRRKCTK